MNQLSNESHEATGRRGDCVVMKFGGTSVEDAAAIRRVSQLVKRRLRPPARGRRERARSGDGSVAERSPILRGRRTAGRP